MASLLLNPNGILASSPRLPAKRATLGKAGDKSHQPQRGDDGWREDRRNPVGVVTNDDACPRVASPTRQPWAEGRNPVGIRRRRHAQIAEKKRSRRVETAGENASRPTGPLGSPAGFGLRRQVGRDGAFGRTSSCRTSINYRACPNRCRRCALPPQSQTVWLHGCSYAASNASRRARKAASPSHSASSHAARFAAGLLIAS